MATKLGRPSTFNIQTSVLGVRIPTSTKNLVKKFAAAQGINLNEAVHKAILRLVA